MTPHPHRDPHEWASFNTRFAALLTWLPTLCFWVVVMGSVYGIQKSIESQHPGAGVLIAFAAAYLIQTLNRVSVHFSTRWLASWFFIGQNRARYLGANKHQKIKIIDGVVGALCLLFTASICYFDFRANREASEHAAKTLVSRPDSLTVDKESNAAAITAAQLAVSAAEAAEASERRAYEASVDNDINRQHTRLTKRQNELLAKKQPRPQWVENELKNIAANLKTLPSERRARKNAFVPKTDGVAQAQRNLSKVSSDNSAALIALQTHADTTNIQRALTYEAKKESYSMAMFWLYITAMLLWHLCHAMKAYRALRFDEQHPDSGHPLVAIAQTLLDGLNNLLWQLHAKILYWMPEEEIHGIARHDLLEQTNTPVCRDVYQHILQNPGINELVIYTNLRNRYQIDDIRGALRLLKTAKMVFENHHAWTAEPAQANFFTSPLEGGKGGEQQTTIFNPNSLTASF